MSWMQVYNISSVYIYVYILNIYIYVYIVWYSHNTNSLQLGCLAMCKKEDSSNLTGYM